MPKYLFIFFVLLNCHASLVLAQEDSCHFTLSGYVLDIETKAPIPYVKVKVLGTEKATITDQKGNFEIKGLCQDKNTLIISCFGYSNSIFEDHCEHGNSPHIFLKQDVIDLQGVTVEAKKKEERGTRSISQISIDKDEIRNNPAQSLAELISKEPGVTFVSNGSNVQLPVIHGLYGNRILILNNGLKHGFQNWGTDHAPEIDISSANSIQVIKGATGVRYGSEAMGGAIIIESNPMYLNQPFSVNVGTGFQTNGRGFLGTLEAGQGFKKWSYFLNAKYTKAGDRHTADYSLTNSGKEEKSFGFGGRFQHKNFDFKVHYGFIDQNLALLRSSVAESGNAFVKSINSDEPLFINPFSYTINQPNQLTQHHIGKSEIIWRYSQRGKLTFIVGQQLNKRKEFDVRRKIELPIIDLDLMTSDYQLEWKHPNWLLLDGLIGVQFFTQENNNNPGTGTTPFIPNYKTLRYSAFIVESRRFNKNVFELGMRLDHEINYVAGRETNQDVFRDQYMFTNLTASVGYVREISQNSTFKVNFGTAWRTPNMAELFSFGQHGFKTSFGLLRYYADVNQQLKTDRVIPMSESAVNPERGYKFISELQTTKRKSTHTVSVYSHYIENYIFNRPIAVIGTIRGPMPVFIFDQTNAFFAGIDYTWKREWSKQISGISGFNYLWAKNITRNEALINQPPISLNYKLIWEKKTSRKLESFNFMVAPSYTFTQFRAPRTVSPQDLISGAEMITTNSEGFDFKDAPNGYFLLNISMNFKWKNLSASVSTTNLLNTSYRDYLNEMRYFADEPGTNFLFSIRYFFKSNK